jgi:hypothetical protein
MTHVLNPIAPRDPREGQRTERAISHVSSQLALARIQHAI